MGIRGDQQNKALSLLFSLQVVQYSNNFSTNSSVFSVIGGKQQQQHTSTDRAVDINQIFPHVLEPSQQPWQLSSQSARAKHESGSRHSISVGFLLQKSDFVALLEALVALLEAFICQIKTHKKISLTTKLSIYISRINHNCQ